MQLGVSVPPDLGTKSAVSLSLIPSSMVLSLPLIPSLNGTKSTADTKGTKPTTDFGGIQYSFHL